MSHVHNVVDADNHFRIDPITRKINPETPEKNELVQYDHNSEQYTFEIPRFVDGHDMSLCDVVEIHFINISADSMYTNADIYIVDDLGSMNDVSDTVAFTWLVSSKATRLVGTLNFAIRFKCITADELDYVWNTKIYSGILVSNGISNNELFVEEYSDILEEWRTSLFGIGDTEEQKIKECSNTEQLSIVGKGNEVKEDITSHGNDVKNGITNHGNTIKEDITNHGNTIKEDITNHGNTIKEDITNHGNTIKEDITSHGTDVKNDITNHSNVQKNSIDNKGAEVLNNIKLDTGLTVIDGKLCVVFDNGQS